MRVRLTASVALLFALALIGPGGAAAITVPPNDLFADAIQVPSLPVSPPSAVTPAGVVTTGAALEVSEPQPCGTTPSARTVWYHYVATTSGAVRVDPRDSSFDDVVLTWYTTGSGGAGSYNTGFNDLTFIRCGSVSETVLTFSASAGREYFIQATDSGSGGGSLMLHFSYVAPPANDLIAYAQPVDFSSSAQVETSIVTVPAGYENSANAALREPRACGGNIRTVWYRIAVPWNGIVTVSPSGSSFADPILAAYVSARTSGVFGGGLTSISCSPELGDPITFAVTRGATYFVQALDYGSGGGTLHLTFTFDAQPSVSAPDDSTVEATGPDGETVSYDPIGFDLEDGDLPVTCDPASGWTFPLGSTFVECVATDSIGQTGGAWFWVTVVDTTAPVIEVSGAQALYAVDGSVAIAAGATDLVAGDVEPVCVLTNDATAEVVSTSCSPSPSAWSLGLGSFTFSASATDGYGNTSSTSVSFRVRATYASVSSLTGLWVSKAGVARELLSILDSAAAAELRGQTLAEAGKLANYRALLTSQSGKSISAANAALLIAFSYSL